MQLKLVYGKEVDKASFRDLSLYSLIGYMNIKLASDPKNRKFIIGDCFFLNRIIVLWSSKM